MPNRSTAGFCPVARQCCVPPLEGCGAGRTLGLPCLLSPGYWDAISLPFPGPSHINFCPPAPVFLQREPLQPKAIACCLPLRKETSQGLQASASSCTGSWLPTNQTQGKRAVGSRGGKSQLCTILQGRSCIRAPCGWMCG